jgi:hypothetical protein
MRGSNAGRRLPKYALLLRARPPVQVTPLPVKPALQAQAKPPGALAHSPLGEQKLFEAPGVHLVRSEEGVDYRQGIPMDYASMSGVRKTGSCRKQGSRCSKHSRSALDLECTLRREPPR